MVDTLSVLWTVVPDMAPQPCLHCSRCGKTRPFLSSARFRVNANGRRIDAWLIYRCAVCDNTWNRPVLERCKVGAVDRSLLEALWQNDPALAQRLAFDVSGLQGHAECIEASAKAAMHKRVLSDPSRTPQRLAIDLVVPQPVRLRLDRLLAGELGLARGRVHELHARQRLAISPASARTLRAPLRDGTRILIDLSGEADAAAISAAATSPPRQAAPGEPPYSAGTFM